MVVRVFPPGLDEYQELAPSTDQAHGRVEALWFQRAVPPVFEAVYPDPGSSVLG